MHDKCRFARTVKFLRLRAGVVGIEDKGVCLDLLEQHHPRVRHPAFVHGGQGYGIGIIDLGQCRFVQPPLRNLEWVVAGKYSFARVHDAFQPTLF